MGEKKDKTKNETNEEKKITHKTNHAAATDKPEPVQFRRTKLWQNRRKTITTTKTEVLMGKNSLSD